MPHTLPIPDGGTAKGWCDCQSGNDQLPSVLIPTSSRLIQVFKDMSAGI